MGTCLSDLSMIDIPSSFFVWEFTRILLDKLCTIFWTNYGANLSHILPMMRMGKFMAQILVQIWCKKWEKIAHAKYCLKLCRPFYEFYTNNYYFYLDDWQSNHLWLLFKYKQIISYAFTKSFKSKEELQPLSWSSSFYERHNY